MRMMEMTLLQAQQRLHEKWMEFTKDGTDEEMMQALSIADQVLGSYDESLKTDMVAMLTEIQLEIEEMKMQSLTIKETWNNAIDVCSDRIQQKIDKLKE